MNRSPSPSSAGRSAPRCWRSGCFWSAIVAYGFLPVAAVPNVDFPMIRVSASRPGADPSSHGGDGRAPLERRLGEIAGVTEITSTSSLGSTSIQLQFDDRPQHRRRRARRAGRDQRLAGRSAERPAVAAAFRKANPAAAPVLCWR
jgi:multidrug efflux pump